jgi:hypothetical protein
MNLRTFAQQLIFDPAYKQSVIDRAKAGTLSPDLEELIWSIADARTPVMARAANTRLTLLQHPASRAATLEQATQVATEVERRLATEEMPETERAKLQQALATLAETRATP